MAEKIVYCIEDEDSIRELVAYVLRGQNYRVETFDKSQTFWSALQKTVPHLILLDIMLPDEDGLTILEKLRSTPIYKDIPVIMVTAKTTEYDIIQGLEKGADDYIKKPFSIIELLARVKALLRRAYSDDERDNTILKSNSICIYKDKHVVTIGGEEVELTAKEYELLQYLLENKEIVLSREQIMNAVWGVSYEGETRTVDMHIVMLRQKLKDEGKSIKTIRSVGYRWKER